MSAPELSWVAAQRPRRLPSAGYPVDPPFAVAGDTVDAPCPTCKGLPGGYRGYDMKWVRICDGPCGGRGTVPAVLTADPERVAVNVTRAPGEFTGKHTHAWLCTATPKEDNDD